jgi:uncharacterized protein (DUF433 family)
MSSPPIDSARQYVSNTPGVCGGKPCIAGTRIRVQDIYVWHELQGQSVDEIVNSFPQLTHAGVYAALSYFWENRQTILDQMRAGKELVEELKAKYPSKLRAKLGGQLHGDSLPS